MCLWRARPRYAASRRSPMRTAVLVAGWLALATAAAAQTPAIPRTADGKPDFSGIWEVLGQPDFNIEPHSASRIAPASAGIVEGGTLPYKPGMAEKRQQNFAARATADTESKCYLP